MGNGNEKVEKKKSIPKHEGINHPTSTNSNQQQQSQNLQRQNLQHQNLQRQNLQGIQTNHHLINQGLEDDSILALDKKTGQTLKKTKLASQEQKKIQQAGRQLVRPKVFHFYEDGLMELERKENRRLFGMDSSYMQEVKDSCRELYTLLMKGIPEDVKECERMKKDILSHYGRAIQACKEYLGKREGNKNGRWYAVSNIFRALENEKKVIPLITTERIAVLSYEENKMVFADAIFASRPDTIRKEVEEKFFYEVDESNKMAAAMCRFSRLIGEKNLIQDTRLVKTRSGKIKVSKERMDKSYLSLRNLMLQYPEIIDTWSGGLPESERKHMPKRPPRLQYSVKALKQRRLIRDIMRNIAGLELDNRDLMVTYEKHGNNAVITSVKLPVEVIAKEMQLKKEALKKEAPKQDLSQKEDLKQENLKQEKSQKEDLKQENSKKEDLKQEITEEEVKEAMKRYKKSKHVVTMERSSYDSYLLLDKDMIGYIFGDLLSQEEMNRITRFTDDLKENKEKYRILTEDAYYAFLYNRARKDAKKEGWESRLMPNQKEEIISEEGRIIRNLRRKRRYFEYLTETEKEDLHIDPKEKNLEHGLLHIPDGAQVEEIGTKYDENIKETFLENYLLRDRKNAYKKLVKDIEKMGDAGFDQEQKIYKKRLEKAAKNKQEDTEKRRQELKERIKIKDYSNQNLFERLPSPLDVKQGKVGDCFLMAAFTEMALQDPVAIMNSMKDNLDGTVTVRLYKVNYGGGDSKEEIFVKVPKAQIYLEGRKDDINVNYRTDCIYGCKSQALWVKVLERAFAQSGLYRDYKFQVLNNGKAENQMSDFLLLADSTEDCVERKAMEECGVTGENLRRRFKNGEITVQIVQEAMEKAKEIKKSYLSIYGGECDLALHILTGKAPKKDRALNNVRRRFVDISKYPAVIPDAVKTAVNDYQYSTKEAEDVSTYLERTLSGALEEYIVQKFAGTDESITIEDFEEALNDVTKMPKYQDYSFRRELRKIGNRNYESMTYEQFQRYVDQIKPSILKNLESFYHHHYDSQKVSPVDMRRALSIKQKLHAGKKMTCGCYYAKGEVVGEQEETAFHGFVTMHAYTIMDVLEKEQKIVLRNPWGAGYRVRKLVKGTDGKDHRIDRAVRDEVSQGIFKVSINEFFYFFTSIWEND